MADQGKKLKPIVFTTNRYQHNAPQNFQQVMLLKAMQVTTDPKELRKMVGLRSVAEVYRTLDKLSMRKEYHEALARRGISFDYIVQGIAKIAEEGEKDKDRLSAFQTLLKSLGLEKYDSTEAPAGGDWQQELIKALEKKGSEGLPSGGAVQGDYEVDEPEIPGSARKAREDEEDLVKGIYE